MAYATSLHAKAHRAVEMKLRYLLCIVALLGHPAIVTGAAASETMVMGGTGLAIGLAHRLADAYGERHPDLSIVIPDSVGSSGGIRAVADGAFDLAYVARPLRDEEKPLGLAEIAFLRTPYVLAVSTQVGGVLDLASDDVLRAYSGELTHWPDGTPLRCVVRDENDTGSQILSQQFPGLAAILDRQRQTRGTLVAFTDQDAMDLAERVPGALAMSTLLTLRTEDRALQAVAIDGVEPTVDNLRSGIYPMDVTLRIVLGPQPSAHARDFVTFIQSASGRDLLEQLGAMPIDMDMHD
ncbi:MAG: substrate-binding domain-containing protein [Rhodospirillaceae bacterium]|nr:substrate-binding domain-containing protein [Rhodospirillaceae bacterium]